MKSIYLQHSVGLTLNRVASSLKPPCKILLVLCILGVIFSAGCSNPNEKANHKPINEASSNATSTLCDTTNSSGKSNTVTAEVVALEQIITYNRFGAFNPAGMVYALRKDVVYDDPATKDRQESLPLPEASKLDDPEFALSIAGKVSLKSDKRPRPMVLRVNEGECLQVKFWNLLSPSPTVHTKFERADFIEGGVQRHAVQETPVDNPAKPDEPKSRDISTPPRCFDKHGNKAENTANCKNLFPFPRQEEPDYPTTRSASIHVNGLDYVPTRPENYTANIPKICADLANSELKTGQYTPEDKEKLTEACRLNKEFSEMGSDGANVGNNPSSLVNPGEHTTYKWYARQEGGYFMYSAGALAGGEGDGGQLGLGLFGSINVEPKGSIWYRSQVTYDDLCKAVEGAKLEITGVLKTCKKDDKEVTDFSKITYEKLAITDTNNAIQHSDLNAIIYQTLKDENGHSGNLGETSHVCSKRSPGSSCGMSFREFTAIFHDENKVFQAFAELSDEGNPISAIADGMAINYGSSGVGSAVLANMKKIGPAKDCPECKLEEFFLSSWVNGDPAMIVRRDMDGNAVEALYPDDPSNVHHSYLGDPVRFRNIHAGPKETHVFHLHAHQWLQDKNDPNANYLDSQTISPGSSYTYDIQYGGGGNRNLTVGDAIFHCHLYPHFAAGMWELWRNHDVFEDGKPGLFNKDKPVSAQNDPKMRNLPDYELADKGGSPNPAIVPIPDYPLAPMPTKDLRGYPFFVAGVPGHRPPQPPLDMAFKDPKKPESGWLDGGLPRHIIMGGVNEENNLKDKNHVDELLKGFGDASATKASRTVAERTWKLNSDPNNLILAKKVESANLKILPQCGTKEEILAMAYHAGWAKDTISAIIENTIQNGDSTEIKQNKENYHPDKLNLKVWQACRTNFEIALSRYRCPPEKAKEKICVPEGKNHEWPNIAEESTKWPFHRPIHNDTNPNPQESTAYMSALWQGMGYESTRANIPNGTKATEEVDPGHRFRVNGYGPAQGAPFADPCPNQYFEQKVNNNMPFPVNRDEPRLYKSAYIQFDMTVNQYGWHDPQARMPVLEEDAADTISGKRLAEPLFFRANSGDCIQFQATNLIPSVLNLDDFQVYTPTDTIGQHIHLVKFDVTSSDGSANGWNYEDGTFSPDEVRERIAASSKAHGGKVEAWNGDKLADLKPTTYSLPKGTSAFFNLGKCASDEQDNNHYHPWCGAQTTVQRWWADPVMNHLWEDRTMRAVFTHDHYGPSSHQQHGFYAALVVEPKDSVWTQLGGNPEKVVKIDTGKKTSAQSAQAEMKLECANALPSAIGTKAYGGGSQGKPLKCRNDGGPTSYAANIGFTDPSTNNNRKPEVRREYNLAFADFAILYNADLRPVNPPGRQDELLLPHNVRNGLKPKPEGISTEDPGTRLLNYRNEPIPLRIAEEDKDNLEYHQKLDQTGKQTSPEGNMANVFSSVIHNKSDKEIEDGATRIKTLEKLGGYEITDRTTLMGLLDNQKANTKTFKQNLQKNEPWRKPGDPSTPLLAAYEGDPIQLHLIQGAQEEQHVFSINGMDWLAQPKSLNSSFMSGQQIGISEHFEFETVINVAPSVKSDYWYGSPAVENMWDGMWGLIRSFGVTSNDDGLPVPIEQNGLARLPESAVEIPPLPIRSAKEAVCPADKLINPKKIYVTAWQASEIMKLAKKNGLTEKDTLTYNSKFNITDPNAVVFFEIPEAVVVDPKAPNIPGKNWTDGARILDYLSKNKLPIKPMVLRANAGECVKIEFMNYLPGIVEQMDGNHQHVTAASYSYNLMPPIVNGFNFNQVQMSSHVGLVPQLVAENVFNSLGSNIGFNRLTCDDDSDFEECRESQRDDYLKGLPGGCLNSDAEDLQEKFKQCNSNNREEFQAFYTWYMGHQRVISTEYARMNPCDPELCSDELIEDANKSKDKKSTGTIRFTPTEFGAVALRSFGDVIKHSSHGLVGALVVEPKDAVYCPPGLSCDGKMGIENAQLSTAADIQTKAGEKFREFVLVVQDDLSLQQQKQPMPNHRMADDAEDTGQKGFNYGTEPLWARNGIGTSGADFNELNNVDYSNSLSSIYPNPGCQGPCGDPKTEVFSATAGDPVRFRMVHPGGHSRQHAFVLYGHNWDFQPWIKGSTELFDNSDGNEESKLTSSRLGAIGGIGPARHVNILTNAGGKFGVPGDYLFRVQEQFQFQGGMWGILRVNPKNN
jgi:hypothetical protein